MIKRIYLIVTEYGKPWLVRLAGVILLAFAIIGLWAVGLVGLVVAPFIAVSAGVGIVLVLQADELEEKQQKRRSLIETYYDHQWKRQ